MYDKKMTWLAMLSCILVGCLHLTIVCAQETGESQDFTPEQRKRLSSLLRKNPQLANKMSATVGHESQQTESPTRQRDVRQADDDTQDTPQASSSDASASDDPDDLWGAYHDPQLKQAFEAVKRSAFALTPEQIEEMHDMLDDTQRAVAADPYRQPPSPTSSSLVVNLSPGSVPPVIRLARGFVSSLVFIDATGAPWPIQAYDLGNPKAFNIKWNRKDNTLMVQATSGYTYGNLAVILQDLETPVMLTLVPGQKVVDYRVDLRVQGMGPNATVDAIKAQGLPGVSNPKLLGVLDGIPPQHGKRLMVNGGGAEAWLVEDKIYLRSRYKVISPAWFAKLSSADGMSAYELPLTPVVLLSHYGKAVPVKITGF